MKQDRSLAEESGMKIIKHRETVYCPWCSAGARMAWSDEHGEYCMACRRSFKTGKMMELKN